MDRTEILDRLKAAGKRPDAEIDLGETALLFAAAEYPDLDLAREVGFFDSLARAASRAVDGDSPLGAANALSRFLFDDLGFAGNQRDYYDPRNSYVNEVLKRRVGIPITLSLVYMEVGRRTGVPMQGVGLPGHFLMRHAEEPGLFIDAFPRRTAALPRRMRPTLPRPHPPRRALERRVPRPHRQARHAHPHAP